MERDDSIIFVAVLFILTVVMFFPLESETIETQSIKIGIMTYNERTNASEMFLANQAIQDINQYCLNHSLSYRFIPVFKSEIRAEHAIEMVDEFHRENVSIIVGIRFSGSMDACDYQSKHYGMVIVSPYCESALHRDVYKHIFQLTPVSLHEAQVAARSMIELGFSECVIFTERSPEYEGFISNEFMKYYTELGGTVTDSVLYNYSTDPVYINRTLTRLEDACTRDVAVYSPEINPYSPFGYELGNYPKLLNHTWFGSSYMNSNYTAVLSITQELAEILMINPAMNNTPDYTDPLYREINAKYVEEFGENMTRYTGNIYDAVTLSALTVIETGEYNNMTFIETFPELAKDYTGVSGNCSLDQYGDRLHASYHIFKFVLYGWDIYLKEIGYYDTSKLEIEWNTLQ
jgi:ABC-type branched-subunit amino acid transport system substrate-binding protein